MATATITNPYSPPATDQVTDGPGRGTITYSDFEAEAIRRMATSMRVVSILQFVTLGLLMVVLVTLALALSRAGSSLLGGMFAKAATIGVGVFGVYAVIAGLAAVWLMQSSRAFSRSLLEETTDGLAQGFAKLRSYLIVYGVFAIINVAASLLGLAAGSAMRVMQ